MHLAVAQAPVARGDVAANLAAAARLLEAAQAQAQAECGRRLDLLAHLDIIAATITLPGSGGIP